MSDRHRAFSDEKRSDAEREVGRLQNTVAVLRAERDELRAKNEELTARHGLLEEDDQNVEVLLEMMYREGELCPHEGVADRLGITFGELRNLINEMNDRGLLRQTRVISHRDDYGGWELTAPGRQAARRLAAKAPD